MTAEYSRKFDPPARCSTALGRAIARFSARWSPTRENGDDLPRLLINQPGQSGTENRILTGLIVFTIIALCFSGLLESKGWPWAIVLFLPIAFLLFHLVLFAGVIMVALIDATGLTWNQTRSHRVGTMVIIIVTSLCLFALCRGGPLHSASAIPWIAVFILNAVAWFGSFIRELVSEL